jgi:hypothetical protein
VEGPETICSNVLFVLDIKRSTLTLELEGLNTDVIECELDGQLLRSSSDYLVQNLSNTKKMIILNNPIERDTILKIR